VQSEWSGKKSSYGGDLLEIGITEPKTDAVIRRATRGDANAITELYERYKPVIYRYFYHRVGGRQVAEELTTEVFIRVIENLPRYETTHIPFRAWLFKIARNMAIDHFRRNKTRQHVPLDENDASPDGLPETIVENQADIERLHSALTRLTPDQCDVIVLRFLSGMPIREVAHSLNKSEGSVKMLQSRALEALYEMLK
jgi:RNA polymerase sigma-70 factor, ECF subfamily